MAVSVDSAGLLLERIAEVYRHWRDVLLVVGVGTCSALVVVVTCSALRSLWTHFGGALTTGRRLRWFGSWVAVVGSRSGLRDEFLKRFASFGFNLLVIDDGYFDAARLAYFELQFGIKAIAQDATALSSEKKVENLRNQLAGLDIGILVDTSVRRRPSDQDDARHVHQTLMRTCVFSIASAVVQSAMRDKHRGLVVNISPFFFGTLSEFADFYKNYAYRRVVSGGKLQYQMLTPLAIDDAVEDGGDSQHPVISSMGLRRRSLLSDWCYHFWVPRPKVYVRHCLWTLGRTDISTGYLPQSFLAWWIETAAFLRG